jgi:hypothetical protein
VVERRFVSRVAERLVPNADLILLVGRADDLTFLSAEHLALPGLSDWQITPHRFRVVTTFSFTPPSIRDFTRETGCWGDEEAYRQRLIGQIEDWSHSIPRRAIRNSIFRWNLATPGTRPRIFTKTRWHR